jgi:RNA polymerase sigma-70 factor, ECF subfamily
VWQRAPAQLGAISVSAAASGRVDQQDLNSLDDRQLVEACVAGTEGAFDLVVERHGRSIYQVCYRFVGNHADATDLAQEVFLRAFRALKGFKGESALGTWLYRIAVNASLNRVTAKAPRTEPIERTGQLAALGPHPVDNMLRRERAARVKTAVARLPPTTARDANLASVP